MIHGQVLFQSRLRQHCGVSINDIDANSSEPDSAKAGGGGGSGGVDGVKGSHLERRTSFEDEDDML